MELQVLASRLMRGSGHNLPSTCSRHDDDPRADIDSGIRHVPSRVLLVLLTGIARL